MLQNQLVELERKEKQENQRLFQDRDAAIGMLQQVSDLIAYFYMILLFFTADLLAFRY